MLWCRETAFSVVLRTVRCAWATDTRQGNSEPAKAAWNKGEDGRKRIIGNARKRRDWEVETTRGRRTTSSHRWPAWSSTAEPCVTQRRGRRPSQKTFFLPVARPGCSRGGGSRCPDGSDPPFRHRAGQDKPWAFGRDGTPDQLSGCLTPFFIWVEARDAFSESKTLWQDHRVCRGNRLEHSVVGRAARLP